MIDHRTPVVHFLHVSKTGGFQETLNDDFRSLLKKIGLPDDIQLPTDEIETQRAPADSDRRLSDEAVKNLRVWFAADYRLLETCREMAAFVNSRPPQSGGNSDAAEHGDRRA